MRTDSLAGELPEGFIQINPGDAGELEIGDGERVIVRSRRGRIEVKAGISGDVASGVAFVPFHFAGTRANVLTNLASDPAYKMPEFKVFTVNIENVLMIGVNCSGTLSPVPHIQMLRGLGIDPYRFQWENIDGKSLLLRFEDGNEQSFNLDELEERGRRKRK